MALKYHELITRALGIGISKEKSLVGTGVAEFAKSVFLNGRMVSSVPLNALVFRPDTYLGDATSLLRFCYYADIPVTPSDVCRVYNAKTKDRMLRVLMSPLMPYYIDCQGSFYPDRYLEVLAEVTSFNRKIRAIVKPNFFSRNIDNYREKYFSPTQSLFRQVIEEIGDRNSNGPIWQVGMRYRQLKGISRLMIDPFVYVGKGFIT